ncbi:hypothetical protein BH09MYX1_BH09MYX1_12680 [soil metagenome]
MATVTIRRKSKDGISSVELTDGADSLQKRGVLPGAFGYDRAAHLFRTLQAEGSDPVDLLPAAYPTSWMVNSKASSRTFVQWALMEDTWRRVFEVLKFDRSLDEWKKLGDDDRARVAADVATLASAPGATLVSVTKVLTLLVPQLVPLMDDAAIAWAIGAVPEPTTAAEPKAGAEHFLPMMDWFADETTNAETSLIALARDHELAVLDAPQVLDRLLWFESWGRKLLKP